MLIVVVAAALWLLLIVLVVRAWWGVDGWYDRITRQVDPGRQRPTERGAKLITRTVGWALVAVLGLTGWATYAAYDELTLSSDELYDAALRFTDRYPIGDAGIGGDLIDVELEQDLGRELEVEHIDELDTRSDDGITSSAAYEVSRVAREEREQPDDDEDARPPVVCIRVVTTSYPSTDGTPSQSTEYATVSDRGWCTPR